MLMGACTCKVTKGSIILFAINNAFTPKGDLFLSQLKSHPARWRQNALNLMNQAHVNVGYKLSRHL